MRFIGLLLIVAGAYLAYASKPMKHSGDWPHGATSKRDFSVGLGMVAVGVVMFMKGR